MLFDKGEAESLIRTAHVKEFRFVGKFAEGATKPVAVISKPGHTEFQRLPIIILPFENQSGDPDQVYCSDGIINNIISKVWKICWCGILACR